MYDMYPWNDRPGPATSGRRDDSRPEAASRPAAETGTAPAAEAMQPMQPMQPMQALQALQAIQAMQAVQVALDRRDNGGDAVGAVSPATSGRTRQ